MTMKVEWKKKPREKDITSCEHKKIRSGSLSIKIMFGENWRNFKCIKKSNNKLYREKNI